VLFFFQAEDGIRDWSVTGVQTCALPIYIVDPEQDHDVLSQPAVSHVVILLGINDIGWPSSANDAVWLDRRARPADIVAGYKQMRSEERRVGKECRTTGSGEYV